MIESSQEGKIGGLGCCSIKTAYGMPNDYYDAYTLKQLDNLHTWAKGFRVNEGGTGALIAVSSDQMKAKKVLEDDGFEVLGMLPSCHLNDEDIADWKTPKDGRTVYLMGKGFFTQKPVVKEKKKNGRTRSTRSRRKAA